MYLPERWDLKGIGDISFPARGSSLLAGLGQITTMECNAWGRLGGLHGMILFGCFRVVSLQDQGGWLGLVLYCKLFCDTEAFSGFPSVLLRAAVRWMSSMSYYWIPLILSIPTRGSEKKISLQFCTNKYIWYLKHGNKV